jgi:hypothetical protein
MKKIIQDILPFTKKRTDLMAIILLILVVSVFFYRTILSGKLPIPSDALVGLYHPYRDVYEQAYPNGIPFKNFLITDPVRQQIPWRKSAIESIKRGRMPVWDADSFAGTPLLGNIQAGVFYPLNVLFLFLPFSVAWTLLVISQPLFAGIFLYWFLRRKNLDIASAFLGALCFAFSGFSIAWLTWGTMLSTWLWTPLSMIAIDAIAKNPLKKSAAWIMVLVMSVACSFVAGHIQIFIYSVIFLTIYAFWMNGPKKIASGRIIYLVAGCGIVLLTLPQWIAVLHWLPETGRLMQGSAWHAEGFFIPLRHLIQFFAPDYFGNPATLNYWGTWNYGEMVGYIGVIGLIFAWIGVTTETGFWVLMIAGALLFSVASPISSLPYQFHVPFVSSLQPTRLLVIIDFSLSVLAAYGFSRVTKRIGKKSLIMPFLVIGLCYIGLWASTVIPQFFTITPVQVGIIKRNLIMPTVFFGCAFFSFLVFNSVSDKAKHPVRRLFPAIVMIILIIDLFRFGWKFTPFTDSKYFFPETLITSYLAKQTKPYRIMTTDDRILPPNVNEFYGIESVNGYDPVHSVRYEEFIAAMERGVPDIRPPFGFDRIMVPKNLKSPLFALLGVRFILSFDDLKDPGLRKVASEGKTIVYEKTDSLPRAFLAENVLYKNTKQEIIDTLYDPGLDLRKTAVIEYPVSVLNFPLNTSESVSIQSYTGEQMTLRINTMQPRLLVVGNMFNAGWRVYIDNVRAPLYRTDYLFMGTVVPPGEHVARFFYQL